MKKIICPRCKGNGYILGQEEQERKRRLPNYKHVKQGVCFLCDGSGHADFREVDGIVVKEKDGILLEYSTDDGKYLGIAPPVFEEYEPDFGESNLISVSESIENTYSTHMNDYMSLFYSTSTANDDMSWADDNYVSLEELNDMCNFPDGYSLFDDDK